MINFITNVKDLFYTKGTLTRSQYISLTLMLYIVFTIIYSLSEMNISSLVKPILLIVFGLCLYLFVCITIRRFHDLGLPGDNFFLLFIPLLNIYFFIRLFFQKGVPGENKYKRVR